MFYQSLILGKTPYLAALTPLSPHMPPHWHNEIEILYCLEGEFTAKADGSEHKVRKGQAVFVSSTQMHEYFNAVGQQTTALLLEIGPLLIQNDFQRLAERAFSKPVWDIDAQDSPTAIELFSIFQAVVRELKTGTPPESEWSIRGCLHSLAAVMLRQMQCEEKADTRRTRKNNAMMKLFEAMNYIEEHYQEQITVEEVAKLLGYSKTNFCNQFKYATQLSFHKYLNTFRINMACTLLKETGDPVALIAEKVGLPEAKTFCRVFKEQLGMTPTEYRNTAATALLKQ